LTAPLKGSRLIAPNPQNTLSCSSVEKRKHESGWCWTERRYADGKSRYIISSISDQTWPEAWTQLYVNVDIIGPISYSQVCNVEMKESPQKAQIAHFNGPLTVFTDSPWIDAPSGKEVDLHGKLGTINAKYGCRVLVYSETAGKRAFQQGVFPVVDIEFTSKRPSGAVVERRYALDQVC
jgi:hypothetical protein